MHTPSGRWVNQCEQYGTWNTPEKRRSLDQVRQLLHHPTINTADVKLMSTLLDWAFNYIKDFPFNGPLQVEARQTVGKRIFVITRDGNAEACEHLATWGTIMVAIKGNW